MPASLSHIPFEMRHRKQWVCWRRESRDGGTTKIPYNPNTGSKADSTDPATWVTFEDALTAYRGGNGYDGIGFMFGEDRAFTGLDLDHVIHDGVVDEQFRWIVDAADTYIEVSPGGDGLHILFLGGKPEMFGTKCRKTLQSKAPDGKSHGLEVYDHERYFTFTGDAFGDVKPLGNGAELLEKVYKTYWDTEPAEKRANTYGFIRGILSDSEIIDLMYGSAVGGEIRALMAGDTSKYGNDDSAADLALCNYLAFWCGKDPVQMDRIFRQSGLMRDKWDSPRGDSTYGAMTIQRAIEDCTETYKCGDKTGQSAGNFDIVANVIAESDDEKFLLTEKGTYKATAYNFGRILEQDRQLVGRFSFNELSRQKMVTLPLPWDKGEGRRPLIEWDYSALREYCEKNYNIGNKGAIYDAVLNVCMKNRFNPIAEKLNGLAWDGVPRIRTMLPKYLGVEDNEYQAAVMRFVMLGAVARVYCPGIKFDYVMVLYGKQGTGKSTFVRLLALDDEWFTDSVRTFEGKDPMMLITGKWIAELAEMSALTTSKNIESAKAFLTIQTDSMRAPYEREPEQRPRTCIFIGTTNRMEYLSDQSGDRRFLPVVSELEFEQPTAALISKDAPAEILQCWAEAVHIWKTEKPALVLPHEMQKTAQKMREAHRAELPFEEPLAVWLEAKRLQVAGDEFRDKPAERVCARYIYEKVLDFDDKDFAPKNKVMGMITQYMDGRSDWKRIDGRNRVSEIGGVHKCWVPVRDKHDDFTCIIRNGE